MSQVNIGIFLISSPGSLTNPELTDLTRLPGQQALGIALSLPAQHWHTGVHSYPQHFLHVCETEFLMLVWQGFYQVPQSAENPIVS